MLHCVRDVDMSVQGAILNCNGADVKRINDPLRFTFAAEKLPPACAFQDLLMDLYSCNGPLFLSMVARWDFKTSLASNPGAP
jgi:hypothetical protein